ncbi:T9SS type A sorting domain-containing protein [Winogradskyella sp. SYSU M77433]|uniref:T9SS type A sorting domain-containing protein n=1 Tax=Winogradskyella sp. SYSU M77433 TaxID=3042722 RepID=UPI0024801CAA|nr:T9SS type A sorting domain-containing protein [Winogradskyella sp. SYSU M77433]MDH7911533.1 T9SS type A sorting domain-containing protein [Winogradskyella sp. SYSU M77433]
MKKHLLFCLLTLFISIVYSQSTIVTIDQSNVIGPTDTDNIPSISSVGFTRGSGVSMTTNSSAFTTGYWPVGGDISTAQSGNDYIQWSVTANSTFEIDLDEIDIKLRRNINGPSNWQIFYSLDNFSTAGIPLTSIQSLASGTTTSYNFPSLGISSGNSGTITFRLYAWGASASLGWLRIISESSWTGSLGIPNPGARLLGSVSTASTNSFDSDIITSTFGLFPVQQNIDYTSYTATSGLNFSNAVNLGAFTIRDGGDTSDGDTVGTTLSSIEFEVINSENIATLAILDLSTFTIVSEIDSVTDFTTFSELNLSAEDGGTRQFLVLGSFKTTVTDNEQVQLIINTVESPASGSSLFAQANAGGSATSITGDDNRIEVTASQFIFDQQPTDGNQYEVMVPFPTILAVDSNLNLDVDSNIADLTLTASPSGSIIAENYSMTNGFATFDNVVFSDTESNITLVATGNSISGTSASFNINGPLVNIIEQNFDSTTNWSYTSDTAFFGTVSDWGNPIGYFGEIALANASPLDNPLFDTNIFGENDLNDGTNVFATLTFDNVDISNYSNVRIEFDWQVIGYDYASNDVQYRIATNGSDFSGSWVFVFDGDTVTIDGSGRVKIDIPNETTSVALQIRLKNNRDTGYSGFDNFRVVSEFDGLIYTNEDGWANNIEPNETTGAFDALVIDGNYDVSGDVQLNNLIVNEGATTTVGFGQSMTLISSLTNRGNVELNSISNNYSSLIVNGTVENDIIYNRFVNQLAAPGTTSGDNDLISPPVTNASQTFLAFRTTNPDLASGTIDGQPAFLFGPFDNETNSYVIYTPADDSEILESGIGYRTASDTPSGSTFEFSGSVLTDIKSIPISQGSSSIFNLIGNPYPSYVTLSGFLASNSSEFEVETSGIYGYNGNASPANHYTIWNQAYSDMNPNAKIAPGQGFYVSSKPEGGTITFDPSMRTNGTSDDFIAGRSSSEQNLAFVKLKLSKENNFYSTDLYFNNNASLGLDNGYDTAMFGNVTPSFALYSHLVENNTGKDMAVQTVSFTDLNNVTIPLGVNLAQGEQATISIAEEIVPDDATIILEDNITNTFTNLKDGDYTFTPSTTLTETGRFYIHMSRESLSTTENILNGLEIYTESNPKTITIKGQLDSNTTFNLYDIQGRLVNSQALTTKSNEQRIDVSDLTSGVYVVQLQNTTSNRTQKVILR